MCGRSKELYCLSNNISTRKTVMAKQMTNWQSQNVNDKKLQFNSEIS